MDESKSPLINGEATVVEDLGLEDAGGKRPKRRSTGNESG
jgi:hypothetical protein